MQHQISFSKIFQQLSRRKQRTFLISECCLSSCLIYNIKIIRGSEVVVHNMMWAVFFFRLVLFLKAWIINYLIIL